jgi:hypothetical protein
MVHKSNHMKEEIKFAIVQLRVLKTMIQINLGDLPPVTEEVIYELVDKAIHALESALIKSENQNT